MIARPARLFKCLALASFLLGLAAFPSAAPAQGRGMPPGQVRRSPIFRPPMVPVQPKPAAPMYLKMNVEDGRITAEIRDAPLQTVMEELASRTGVIFEIQSQENPSFSISLYRVSLQEAIQRITDGQNCIIYYGQDPAGQGKIEFVRVFPRKNQLVQPSLLYIGTGSVTKTGEDTVDTPEDALKALTTSQSVETREKAIETLVATKGEVAVKALTALLEDPSPEIRAAAVEGLASLSAHESLPAIVKALKDKHPGVRQSAIVAVALLGDSENVKDLKPLARDSDASVAAAADMAIRKLSSTRHP